jgi:predicted regulator of Ras-like GTPase activity (Roadblock/LC7/MglB family)
MKQVLEPLVRIPGVRLAALISDDGVPVAVLHNQGQEREAKEKDAIEAAEDFHSYAGLAAGWLSEATRAVGPLSWDAPQRIVLRATRGTLVTHIGPGVVLLVVLDQGLRAEELRIPMESATQRMHRLLRSMSASKDTPEVRERAAVPPSTLTSEANAACPGPPGIHPSRPEPQGSEHRDSTQNPFSEVSGDN